MNSGATYSTINSGLIVRMQKNTLFYLWKRKHSGCQWRVEAVAGAVGTAISGSCSTDSTSRKGTANIAIIPKTTMFNWHINILTMICKRFIYLLTKSRSNDNLAYNRSFRLSTFPATASCVCECDPSALEKVSASEGKWEIVTIFKWGPKQTFDFFAHCILPTIVNISELSFLVSFYAVKSVSCTRCQPRGRYFRIPFDLLS